MTRASLGFVFALAVAAALPYPEALPALYAQAPACSLTGYKAAPGLYGRRRRRRALADLGWRPNQEVRMQLTITSGTPTIKDLVGPAARAARWATRRHQRDAGVPVVSGFRRATDQQIKPLQRSQASRSRPRSSTASSGKRSGTRR